jgi:hypothetical protein
VKEMLLGNCSSGSRVWLGSTTNTTQTMEPLTTHRRRLDMPVRYAIIIRLLKLKIVSGFVKYAGFLETAVLPLDILVMPTVPMQRAVRLAFPTALLL